MKIEETGWENPNIEDYRQEDLKIARDFAQRMEEEVGQLMKALVIFGSLARIEVSEESDIDILIILDDVSMQITDEVRESFRIISEKAISDISEDLHVHTVTLTAYWRYVREGDPIMINILRDGVALIDEGIFEPFQVLLERGGIKPTAEAVYNYLSMAPAGIQSAEDRKLKSVVDLYWSVIDAAHSAIMKEGKIPRTPSEVPRMIKKMEWMTKKDSKLVDRLYNLAKDIMNKKKNKIKGKELDKLLKKSRKFVDKVRKKVMES